MLLMYRVIKHIVLFCICNIKIHKNLDSGDKIASLFMFILQFAPIIKAEYHTNCSYIDYYNHCVFRFIIHFFPYIQTCHTIHLVRGTHTHTDIIKKIVLLNI